jgi:hypothetical protein
MSLTSEQSENPRTQARGGEQVSAGIPGQRLAAILFVRFANET